MGKILRRTFLIGSAAVAGGVAFGYWQVSKSYPNPLKSELGDNEAALTPYVLINDDGVSIIAPRAEMGQGVVTTLAAFVAEELDVELDAVNVIHGPASKAYYNGAILEEGAAVQATDDSAGAERMRNFMHIPAKLLGMQLTGGSSSTPDAYEKMRAAGAAARITLVKAAAKKLDVNAADLKTDKGAVVAPDGARLPYTELAVLARDIAPPKNPPLKPKSEWRLLGKSQPRVDMVGKCTGTAEYALDVRLPGMLFATVKMNPHLDAAMLSYDASKAEAMRGVRKVIPLQGGVAVVATNTWNAFRAAEAVDCEWADPPYLASSEDLRASLAKSFADEFEDSHLRKDGDVEEALAEGDVLEGEYYAPYLAHATMEPLNATALLKDGRLDVWAGNQAPTQVLKEAVAITGLKEHAIHVHTPYMGGGFGRRAEMDFIKQAIMVAKEMEGTPVNLAWSREED
ncbi:MAG: molybdopterin cofactor-binding domain-containing protein, partial [Pseudomonadota bacterium]